MATTDLRKKFNAKAVYRGTQVILGERQHLQEVLRSVQRAKLAVARKRAEVRQLTSLIHVRTQELNRITPGWDRKFKQGRDPKTNASQLLRLAISLPTDDYLLARVLTEHAAAPAELLGHFASHPYSAVRENVARHPNSPPEILARMADDASEPLWFLVACNPSTPPALRERLRARMKQSAPGQN